MKLSESYNQKLQDIDAKLSILDEILKQHNKCFEQNSKVWGYLGDLINLEMKIDDVISYTNMW